MEFTQNLGLTQTLFRVVRALKIDARELFDDEPLDDSPSNRRVCLLINECSEDEAATLLPVIEAVLTDYAPARESKSNNPINASRACSRFSGGRLCALSVRLFAGHHFQFYHVDQDFPFAIRTVERESDQNSILIHLYPRFAATDWAVYP